MYYSTTTIKIYFSGHGSSVGPSWGSPAAIDEVYLRNPMEPMDILKMKDPSSLESPRRVVGAAVKMKTQFNYFRLNDDGVEPQGSESASPVSMPKTNQPISSNSREESLLIDLSPDTPVSATSAAPTPLPFYQQLIEPLVALPDQNRLYANYPSPLAAPDATVTTTLVTSAAESVYSPHYYSEVPIEPNTPTFTPPPSQNTSPARPVVTEELKKKRDEAFDWLGQALGEMTLSKSNGSNARNNQCISPVSRQHQSKTKHEHVYGFEDNFSVSMESPVQTATVAGTSSSNGYHRIQQFQRQNQEHDIEATRQPVYPKPGIWTDESSFLYPPSCPSSQQIYALPGPSRMSAVQTAHVRPFMVAINPPVPHVDDGGRTSSLLNQVELSTPWASEAEIKQALAIHNENVFEAVRFLQVEKLYR